MKRLKHIALPKGHLLLRFLRNKLIFILLFLTLKNPVSSVEIRIKLKDLFKEEGITQIKTTRKILVLTFDDGPGKYTPQILDILERYKVKATFFIVGKRAKDFPTVLIREVKNGHTIANHTYSHTCLTRCNEEKTIEELEKCEGIIETYYGRKTHLFRPPYGLLDGEVLKILKKKGYKVVLWSVCVEDILNRNKSNKYFFKNFLEYLRPGCIILMHDANSETGCSIKILPSLIEKAGKMGYRFVTLEEALEIEREDKMISRNIEKKEKSAHRKKYL